MKNSLLFITYKKLGPVDTTTCDDYTSVVMRLDKFGDILDCAFEKDSKGKWHFHCLYSCTKRPYLKKFVVKGFNFNAKVVFDIDGLMKYIHKCDPDYRMSDYTRKRIFDAYKRSILGKDIPWLPEDNDRGPPSF